MLKLIDPNIKTILSLLKIDHNNNPNSNTNEKQISNNENICDCKAKRMFRCNHFNKCNIFYLLKN